MATETDISWAEVLAHRVNPQDRAAAAERLARYTTPGVVTWALNDLGASMFDLYVRSPRGDDTWAQRFGGLTGALLVLAEIHANAAYVIERAATLRSHAANVVLADRTFADVASELGISPQALHKAHKRPGLNRQS